jgi:hypothetical protein
MGDLVENHSFGCMYVIGGRIKVRPEKEENFLDTTYINFLNQFSLSQYIKFDILVDLSLFIIGLYS